MFRRTCILLLAALSVNMLLVCQLARAGRPPAKTYKLHLVTGQDGFSDMSPSAINDQGDVVGLAWWPEGTTEAFRYTSQTMLVENLNDIAGLPPVDAGWRLLYARGINNAGWITGYAEYRYLLGYREDGTPIYDQDWGVYRYRPDAPIEILCAGVFTNDAGASYAIKHFENATSINTQGDITGIAEDMSSRRFVYTYSANGVFTEIPGPGSGIGVWGPQVINDRGWVAGTGKVNGITNALRYTPATGTVSLGWLRTQGTDPRGAANDMNSNGIVTGEVTTKGTYVVHAFLHDGTKMYDLGAMAGLNTRGRGINNAGVIVGDISTTGAFLYTATAGMLDLKTITDMGLNSQATLQVLRINNNNWILGRLDGKVCVLEPVGPLP